VNKRAHFYPIDVLDPRAELTCGRDPVPNQLRTSVWMSQFLVCFDEQRISKIFEMCAQALPVNGRVFVLDTFHDRISNPVARYCLAQTSPYFVAVANGRSRMYSSEVIIRAAASAGLILEECFEDLGICHTMLVFGRGDQNHDI
jgi:hypothetical protein